MNTTIPYLPERTSQPREYGLTMMMDKGLSVREAENFIESSAEFTDLVKFGFGTSIITKNLQEKINLYKQAGLKPYFGGTLFELYYIRGLFDDYRKFIDKYGLEYAEISDGSVEIPHDEKLRFIETLSQQVTVLSEVGSKRADVHIPDEEWAKMMKTELQAGAWKVIAEARESGTIGIFNKDGSVNSSLIDGIVKDLDQNDILWEAPQKAQQVYFIKLMGANVNLGNIAPNEVVAMEALRLGLRGDTFFDYLPENLKQ